MNTTAPINVKKPVLTDQQVQGFLEDGFVVVPNWVTDAELASIQQLAQQQFQQAAQPMELEVDLGYPGAPESKAQPGGDTPRRLLDAINRGTVWRDYATSTKVKVAMQQLLSETEIYLSQVHHNCLMTKLPQFSSDTGWHQDSRYWSFKKNELISLWLALGQENAENGGLRVIPGSHRMELPANAFDAEKFFQPGMLNDDRLMKKALSVELSPGDVLFFHCRLLHKASRNRKREPKLSLVFTYHGGTNQAIAETRSASQPEIQL